MVSQTLTCAYSKDCMSGDKRAYTLGSETKGWIRKGGKGKRGGEKIYILIDDVTYFVPIKALKALLQGTKETIPLLGYD